VSRSRRIAIAVAAGVAVVAVVAGVVSAGGSGDDGEDDATGTSADEDVRAVQPGAPGEDTRELTDEEVDAVDAPEHSAEDVAFMQDMIVHHGQALAMAELVEERTERDDLPLLAERIIETQEAEIERMTAWLTDRDEDAPDPADHEDHAGDAHMPGMATAAQLDDLAAAEGAAFDRLFLDLMIAHHQGAVTMVEELYLAGGGLEPVADEVARDAEADQNIEIGRMQELRDSL
jgi:uncharacterized protein (DUF305 family)